MKLIPVSDLTSPQSCVCTDLNFINADYIISFVCRNEPVFAVNEEDGFPNSDVAIISYISIFLKDGFTANFDGTLDEFLKLLKED